MLLSQFFLSSPSPTVSTSLFSMSVSPFLLCNKFISTTFLDSKYICVNIQYLFFTFWPISLCITLGSRAFSSSTSLPLTQIHFVLWLNTVPSYIPTTSFVNGHLSCFHVLAVLYSTAMNIAQGCMCLFELEFSQGICPGFLCSSAGKESACSAGDLSSIPGLERSPGEGNGNPLQYPCLENLMDRGAWWAEVHGVAKNRARLSD